MSGDSLLGWRRRYLELAAVARGNAARCTEPEMRDEFLDVAGVWQLMADEIDAKEDAATPKGPTRPGKAAK
jgi:hypothetical protein